MKITQLVQIATFAWRFPAKEFCKLIPLEWYPLQTTPPVFHNHHTDTGSRTGKTHNKSSGCTRTGNKEYAWNCGKNFNILNCQKTEPLHLIGYVKPYSWTFELAGLGHTQQWNRTLLSDSEPEFIPFYKAECPSMAPWITYQVTTQFHELYYLHEIYQTTKYYRLKILNQI